eukprot:scaffold200653_cov36-Prasinocladus_malaysianus.AAC.1
MDLLKHISHHTLEIPARFRRMVTVAPASPPWIRRQPMSDGTFKRDITQTESNRLKVCCQFVAV